MILLVGPPGVEVNAMPNSGRSTFDASQQTVHTMKRKTLFAVAMGAMPLTSCADPAETGTVTGDGYSHANGNGSESFYPGGVLFAAAAHSYFIEHVNEPRGTETFMVAGFGASSDVTIEEEGVAVVTFGEYPISWGGGAGLAQRPVQLDPRNVHYDLSGVTTISFEIRSQNIGVDEVSFGVQWEGPDYGDANKVGGERFLTLEQLGIADITAWSIVAIDVSEGGDIPDSGPERHEHDLVTFLEGKGNQFVKVALMLVWAGSENTDPNSGPLEEGDSLEIRRIAFLDAHGEPVDIATKLYATP